MTRTNYHKKIFTPSLPRGRLQTYRQPGSRASAGQKSTKSRRAPQVGSWRRPSLYGQTADPYICHTDFCPPSRK